MISKINPLDTGYILNVDKTCRRRLGRFLNILYTFDLRPVSMEFALVKIIDQKFEKKLSTFQTPRQGI